MDTAIKSIAASIAVSSTTLAVVNPEDNKLIVSLVSSIVVQVLIKVYDHIVKKRAIRRRRKSFEAVKQ